MKLIVKIIKMLLLSLFMANFLIIAIMFDSFKIRMGIMFFMYLFSFFIIIGVE